MKYNGINYSVYRTLNGQETERKSGTTFRRTLGRARVL